MTLCREWMGSEHVMIAALEPASSSRIVSTVSAQLDTHMCEGVTMRAPLPSAT